MTGSGTWPWYGVAEGDDLGQGDILRSVTLLMPISPVAGAVPGDEIEAETVTGDVIIMTPDCDIQQNKVDMLVLCEVVSFARFAMRDPELGGAIATAATARAVSVPAEDAASFEEDAWNLITGTKLAKTFHDEIAKDRRPPYCLLREFSGTPPFPRSVVSFHRVHAHPRTLLRKAALEQACHLRLLPPYRDYVSRAFGAFFSRVGLFDDVPRLG